MVHMLWPNVHAHSLASIICDFIFYGIFLTYSICVNHLFYADDSVLIAPSPMALKQLIDVCDRR